MSEFESTDLFNEANEANDYGSVLLDLKQYSAFRLYPEILEEVLKSAEIKRLGSDTQVIAENEEGQFVFMSLDRRVERSMRVGNFNDRIFVSDVDPYEFVGFLEVMDRKKFLMSYNTQDDTTFLFLYRNDILFHFANEIDLRRFRLLNSSRALRKFFFYLQDHDVPTETLFLLLDQVSASPRMLEKRSRAEFHIPQITFIQSGAMTGTKSLESGNYDFVFAEGAWFGAGFCPGQPMFEVRLESIDTVFFHSLPISTLEAHLSPDLLLAISAEPCLIHESVALSFGEKKASKHISAKSIDLDKLKTLGVKEDVTRIRVGGFPMSPFHSTLWNFLVLYGQDLNESYISKVAEHEGTINLSQFASALEDAGLITNLRRYFHQSPEVIPTNCLIFFYGRPVIYVKSRMRWVFLLDPVHGLIAVQENTFFLNWNRNLVEVKRPALKEIIREDSKIGMERSEQIGRSLLSYFLNKCAVEFRNLITFKFFQALVVLAVPSFLFGLVNQSVGKTNPEHIYHYYLGIGLFLIFQAISLYSLNIYTSEILADIKTKAQSYFYKLYLNSLTSPLMPLRSGTVSTRLSLVDFAFAALKFERTDLVLYTFMMLLFLLIIGTFSWQATFILLVTTFVALVVIFLLRKRGGFTEVNTATLRQEVIDSFVDIVSGIRSIRVTHTMAAAEKKINETVKLLSKGSGEYTIGMIGINQKGLLIFKIGGVLALYIVCKELVNHRSSPADLFGLTLYLSYLTSPFMGLASYFTTYNTVGLYALPGQLALSQGFQKAKNLRTIKLQGSLQFDRVSFRYSDRSPISLAECSFTINAGERIAIVGRSGSGKSTLVRLIARQIEASAGKILYDGIDSRLIETTSIQAQVGYVPQVPTMFAGSLLSNVAYGEEGPQLSKTKEICRSTHAHQFIRNLPGDYSYMMKEFGIGLSAGQKQMMALTRVLYSEPEILVLDEVTANLDPQAEGFITERVFERKQHRTTVMVVQKISAARRADRIFVMKHGRIIEEGDHNRLMSLGGEYSELYRHQVSDET
jgi:ABC-type bacteriocin/lantibiotic exporter with double-glycine peptidase domain